MSSSSTNAFIYDCTQPAPRDPVFAGAAGRVTQRDVARRYGCHRSTVSLALRGHASIPQRVREQICALANQMGYRPDPSLAMLARNRFSSRTSAMRSALAYIVHSGEACYRTHQLSFLHAAQQRANERGYLVHEFDLAEYPTGKAASNVLFARGVEGMILPRLPLSVNAWLHDWPWERFSTVCCSLGWLKLPFHSVKPHVFDGIRLLWREAASRGYKRIGGAIFRHNPIAEDDHARLGAALATQHEQTSLQQLPLLCCDPFDRISFLEWIERHRPDAVISFLSRAHGWLLEAGYRVPDDIGFACCGIWPHEPYSGLALRNSDVGRAAVDCLIELIHTNQRGLPSIRRTVELELQWIEGHTLPRLDSRLRRRDQPEFRKA